MDVLKSRATCVTTDFALDEETGTSKFGLMEMQGGDSSGRGIHATLGGMIVGKTIKYTKNNQAMAFLTVEDLVGTAEVIVFPKSYETYKDYLNEEEKVFIEGRVSVEDDRPSKLILEKITRFGDIPKELWIAFPSKDAYLAKADVVRSLVNAGGGIDGVFIFLRNTKQYMKLPGMVSVTPETLAVFREEFGEKNVSSRVSRVPRERRRR